MRKGEDMKKILQATTLTLGVMKSLMGVFISKIRKIFRSIVGLDTINMVNALLRFKITTKFFFHNKTGAFNIIMGVPERMIRTMNKNISSTICNTAFPRATFFSQILRKFFTSLRSCIPWLVLIPRNKAFLKVRSTRIRTYAFFIGKMFRLPAFHIFPIASTRTIFSFMPIWIKCKNLVTGNTFCSFHNISLKIKAAFSWSKRKRLSFTHNLLTAQFGHRKSAFSLTVVSIAFLFLFVNSTFAIDDWKVGTGTDGVTGTQNISDLDTTVASYIVDPLDRLLTNYRAGCQLAYTSVTTVTIQPGEIVCSNSAGTARRFRKNTATTTVVMTTAGVGGLDTGSEASSTTYHVYAVADADATTFTAVCSTSATTPTGITYYRYLGSFYNNSSSNIDSTKVTGIGAGRVVQVISTQTGAVASGSTVIANDDTIPQNTEGDEYMTLAITPTSATNKLKIEVIGDFGVSSGSTEVMALFQDTTASAIACVFEYLGSADASASIPLIHYMTAGTTSATTFKIRAGANSGTTTFNGISGGRKYGGAAVSSITITELES